MIMSVDGAHAIDGRSGAMGSDADHEMFHALRGACDAVLVAAGTARAERYRRPTTTDADLVARRAAAGLTAAPQLYLVSRALDLPADMPLREGDGSPPIVLHPAGSDAADVDTRGLGLRGVGTDSDGGVDLDAAIASIGADGHTLVLCEGGPSLLGALHRRGLLDELFVSFSPVLAGGSALGLLGDAPEDPVPVHLRSLLESDGMLLADYLIDR